MPTALALDTWIQTYTFGNFPPIDQNILTELRDKQVALGGNLPGVPVLEPPMTAVPRGRPALQRKRRGDVRRPGGAQPNVAGVLADIPRRAKARCSICKQTGHYAPRCRKAQS